MAQIITFNHDDLEWNDNEHVGTCSICNSYSTSLCYVYKYDGSEGAITREVCSTCRTLSYHNLITLSTYY